jgi:RND family efflux transporter MFP subunit
MHPWIVLPAPGTCPICGATLIPIDPKKFAGEITIDPVITQNIGVRIGTVSRDTLTRTVRTVGEVTYDETRVRDVNTKVGGWIEKMYLDTLGAEVKKGDPLFDYYSPELYTAQEEYLLAYRGRKQTDNRYAKGAQDLLDAARVRLEFFDITASQIRALERRGKPTKTMRVLSPHKGVVIAKNVNEGVKITSGDVIYQIADLSRIWVQANLYEYQLPFVELGQKATMNLAYIPGRSFAGRVLFIYPYLDGRTRSLQVRLEFDNPSRLLKPGMFTQVELHGALAQERILAPREAVIDTGERKVAFVSQGAGKFEPREIVMGIEGEDGLVEILDGLEPGEKVVTSGQFLIDSEAKIRDALAKMVRGNLVSDRTDGAKSKMAMGNMALGKKAAGSRNSRMKSEPTSRPAGSGSTHQSTPSPRMRMPPLDPATQTKLDALVTAYLDLEASLVKGDHKEAMPHLEDLGKAAQALSEGPLKEMVKGMERTPGDHIMGIDGLRVRFKELSKKMIALVHMAAPSDEVAPSLQRAWCPMVKAPWLQRGSSVANPYYGSAMLTCGSLQEEIPGRVQP